MTRDEAIRAAAAVLVEADQLSVSMPVEEAARRAHTPTGPSYLALVASISTRRLRSAS